MRNGLKCLNTFFFKTYCASYLSFPLEMSPNGKSQLIGKDPDAGKDWRQKEKRAAEDEMVRKHHQFKGHELEQTPEDRTGQGSLACCSPWDYKESHGPHAKSWTQISIWTTTMMLLKYKYLWEVTFWKRENWDWKIYYLTWFLGKYTWGKNTVWLIHTTCSINTYWKLMNMMGSIEQQSYM